MLVVCCVSDRAGEPLEPRSLFTASTSAGMTRGKLLDRALANEFSRARTGRLRTGVIGAPTPQVHDCVRARVVSFGSKLARLTEGVSLVHQPKSSSRYPLCEFLRLQRISLVDHPMTVRVDQGEVRQAGRG